MFLCISFLTFETGVVPLPVLKAYILAIDYSPAFLGNSGWVWPGLYFSLVTNADALPKTTKSNKELAPNLLAPCTEATPTYPQAKSPGTIT